MKQTTTGRTLTAILAATLGLSACQQLNGTGEETGTQLPHALPDGNISISGTSIPFTQMSQIISENTVIGGSGSEGAFITNRTVELTPYALGTYEVSRRLYMEVMSRLYDDLRENGYTFSAAWSLPAAGGSEGDETAAKSKKAAAFVEFLGGDIVKVETYTSDFLNGVSFQDPTYFDETNLDLPMGSLQWHDAVIFSNYLSLLTGRTPVYSIDKYLGWENKDQIGVPFGVNNEKLYLYNETTGKSEQTSAQYPDEAFIKAQRNPVSWILDSNWKVPYPANVTPDYLSSSPKIRGDVYTFQNVLTNQRFTFNGIDGSADGYRLPTEAEWEFAARGGDLDAEDWNYVFAGSNDAAAVANTSGSPVNVNDSAYKPNKLGLYHMSGNVSEWVWDLRGKGSDWRMLTISGNAETERNPTKQHADWEANNMNTIWFPIQRIQRGGSYTDSAGNTNTSDLSVFARMGRSKIVGTTEWRDRFRRGDNEDYGSATTDSVQAVRSMGFRLAVFGTITQG